MAVVHVTTWEVAPGRTAEVRSNIRAARAHHERHGVRVAGWQALFAGAAAQRVAYAMASEGLAEHTERLAALEADDEWRTWWDGVHERPEPAARIVSDALFERVAGGGSAAPEPTGGRASVVTTFAPMAFDQRARFLGMADETSELLGRHGLADQVLVALAAGTDTGAVLSVVTAPSLPSLGSAVAGVVADADFAALQRRVFGHPAAPVTVDRTFYTELA